MLTPGDPPRISRGECRYTPFYCEENVWHLVDGDPLRLMRASVAFVSNRLRKCALWSQRAADDPRAPILWDYHVVAIGVSPSGAWVFDLDSRLELPSPFPIYVAETFRRGAGLDPVLLPKFRVIDASTYRRELVSDRSHMRDGTRWKARPPAWPTIGAVAMPSNLERFVDMEREFLGRVFGLDEFVAHFASQKPST